MKCLMVFTGIYIEYICLKDKHYILRYMNDMHLCNLFNINKRPQ